MLRRIYSELQRLWNWLWSKRSEVAQMDYRDAYMAHLVLEILQTSKEHGFIFVPLSFCRPIHPTDNRETTRQATKDRAEKITEEKSILLQTRRLSKATIARLMPSATYLRAVSDGDGGYFTFEGNGRIAALKQVFTPSDGIEIEVDLYEPLKPMRIVKKIRKLRKMHNMK